MFFSHSRTILFIDKEKIRWAKGQAPNGKIFGSIQELPRSENNWHLALENIAANFPRKIRIVAGEEFSYVVGFQKNGKNGEIISEAQALIPEKLQEGWDSSESQSDNVQVMAIQQEFFSALKKILSNSKLQVEAIEVESISISRLIPKNNGQAILVARNDGKILLEAVQGGLVIATKIFWKLPEKEKIQEFINYLSSQKNTTPSLVYIEDKTGDLISIFQSLGLAIQEKVLNPLIGICQKKDLSGQDKKILNIFLNQEASESNTSHGLAFREKVILIVFLVVFLGGMALVYFIIKTKGKDVKMNSPVQKIQEDQAGLRWDK